MTHANEENEELDIAARLRSRAEEIAQRDQVPPLQPLAALSVRDMRRTVHELRVHQIELEMQNEELRRAQVELDIARARYFDLYDLAPVGYLTLSAEGLIQEANLTAAKLLGVGRRALVEQHLSRFILKEDQDIYYLHHKQLKETGEPSSCELRMVNKDQTVCWVQLTSSTAQEPALDSDLDSGAAILSRIVLNNITERKEAEEQKATLEAQLQQAKKLETLGVLAGGVAHDFNNLLTAILGNATLGTLAVEPNTKVAHYFAVIETASLRAADLTRQLLAYAGKGKNVVTEVDLDIVLKEVLQLSTAAIPKQVTLRLELANRLPFVLGDSTQLFQILMNLITNAGEAFAEGQEGLITIRTCAEAITEADLQAIGWILPMPPGHFATLEVTDSGVGMTPEVQAQAFDPFFTTKFTGRGLGLAAVVGVLGSHGGGLSLRSELGHGTSFKIFLPAIKGARLEQAGVAMPTWRGEGLILVVDDEELVRNTARNMAERLGFSVVEAWGGLEAVDLFRLHHADLALVLLDLSMPRMNGLEAQRQMQVIDSRVPVVLSSGYDMQDANELPDGFAGFLPKPYRLAEMQGILQRLLNEPEGGQLDHVAGEKDRRNDPSSQPSS